MFKSKRFISILIFTAVFVLVIFLLRGNEDSWICENGEWIKHGNPTAQKPTEKCSGDSDSMVSLVRVSDFRVNRLGDLVCGEGVIKNTSATTLGYVRATFLFYTNKGGVYDFSEGYIGSKRGIFMPNEEAQFKRCVDDKDISVDLDKTKIYFEGNIGDSFKREEIYFKIEK